MPDICQKWRHWKCTERFLGSFSAFHDVVSFSAFHDVMMLMLILSCTRHFNKEILQMQASSGTLFLVKNVWKLKTLRLNISHEYWKLSYTYCSSWEQFRAEILSCTLFQYSPRYPGSSHSIIKTTLVGYLSIFMIWICCPTPTQMWKMLL